MNKLDVIDFYYHQNFKKGQIANFTGSVVSNFSELELHLFYAINGKKVSDKEWFNLTYTNKLEDILNE